MATRRESERSGPRSVHWFLRGLSGPFAVLVAVVVTLIAVEFAGGGREPALGSDDGQGGVWSTSDPTAASRRQTTLEPVRVEDTGDQVRFVFALSAIERRDLRLAESAMLRFAHSVGRDSARIVLTGDDGRSVDVGAARGGIVDAEVLPLLSGSTAAEVSVVADSVVPSPTGTLLASGERRPQLRIVSPSTTSLASMVLVELNDLCGDRALAERVFAMSGAVVASVGDLAPSSGYSPMVLCWDELGGDRLWRSKLAPGPMLLSDRESLGYLDPGRSEAAGAGYFSFDLAGANVLVLSGHCDQVGGCGPESPQFDWFQSALAAARQPCVIVYWSGEVTPALAELASANADFVVPGSAIETIGSTELQLDVGPDLVRWTRTFEGGVSEGIAECSRGR